MTCRNKSFFVLCKTFNYLCCVVWPAFALLLFLTLFGGVSHADLYVAPEGFDGNSGTKEKPFATLEHARDAVRTMKHNAAIPKGGLTVWLRGGDYLRTETFELTAADSGLPDAPITWQAYSNERVRLVGGRVITGFQPVTGKTQLARLDTAAQNNVLAVDLRALGIKNFGTLQSRGFGRLHVPAHGELFFGGSPMTLARWPNEGNWVLITGFPRDTGTVDKHGGSIGALTAGFYFEGDRPKRWHDRTNLWVHGYWAFDWANSYEKVAELNYEQHHIRTEKPYGQYGFRKGQRFYYLNILEELDEPGEWFLDGQTGILYFWPPGALDAGKALFSLLETPLIKLTGTNYVTLRGIVFEATRGNAIEIQGGTDNRIVGCLIRNIGNWAVTISGGRNHGVISCNVFDTGDGGVSLSGGDRQTLTPGGHFVENCHFAYQGRWSKCYMPAVQMHGVGLRASHNHIHDHPHSAIIYGGNGHIIEYNDIHHVALETGDVGAIYAGRDFTYRDNRIQHNYIHEIGDAGMDSVGVYLDDCVSGVEVFGNVFYKVQLAVLIGGGRDHRVENNLFMDCKPAVRADGRGLDSVPVWRNMVDVTMRALLSKIPLALYRQRYPALKTLDAYYGAPAAEPIVGQKFTGIPPEGNGIMRNVCFGDWIDIASHAKQELFDIHDNFVTKDPSQFGRPETGFRLPTHSLAWEKGFKPIPFEQIGLRSDSDRERLSTMW